MVGVTQAAMLATPPSAYAGRSLAVVVISPLLFGLGSVIKHGEYTHPQVLVLLVSQVLFSALRDQLATGARERVFMCGLSWKAILGMEPLAQHSPFAASMHLIHHAEQYKTT